MAKSNKEYYIKLQAKMDDSQKQVEMLNKQITTLQNKVKTLEIKVKAPDLSKSGFGKLSPQLKQLGVNMGDFKNNILSVNSTFDTTTTRYTNNAGKILTVTERMVDGQKRYKVALKEVNSAAENNAKQADKWNYSWSKAFQSFVTYMTVTKVFYGAINAIKDMIGVVTELDSALIELKKVTDLEGTSLENFVQQAYEAGAEVAKTGKEMVEAATSFAKAGYDEDQILGLGKVAAMYTNIADEAISSADAADFIIAQLKAFNLEAKDANTTLENAYHIIDAVNEVSNNFAVSSSDIAMNLGKASSVMANAGNSLEEMIGLMTAGTEITRNASKVANGLKTITLRLQGMSDEGEESFELMSKMEDMFNKLGKTVYDSNGELKSTYKLLGELADVYPDLTVAEKAYVTETIAGKYQAQNAAAILSNWKTAIDATTTALDSQGSAAKENAKVLDGVEGKLASFRAAFEQLSSSFMDSGFLKVLIDIGTILLKLANNDIVIFLARATALFAIFKVGEGGVRKFGEVIKNVKTNIQKMRTTLQEYESVLKKVKNATDAERTAEEAAIITNGKALKTQLLLNAAFGAAALLITAGIAIYQNYKQKEQEVIQSALENASDVESKLSSLKETTDRIKQLRETIDDSTTSYSESYKAREELIEIQNDLIKNYGAEADKINLVSGSIEKQIEELKKLRKESAQDYLRENRLAIEKAEKKVYGKNIYKRDVNLGIKPAYALRGKEPVERENEEAIKKYIKDVDKIMRKYASKIGDDGYLSGSFQFTTESVDNSKKALQELLKYVDDSKDKLIADGVLTKESYKKMSGELQAELNKIQSKFGDYYDTLSAAAKMELTAAGFDDFKEDLLAISKESAITAEDIQKLIDKQPGLKEALDKSDYTVEKLLKQYQNYDKVVDEIGDKLGEDFTNDILKMVDANDLSYESFNKLLEKYPELQTYLDKYSMKITDYADKIGELVEKQLEWGNAVKKFGTEVDELQDAFQTLTDAQDEYNENKYLTVDTLQKLLDLDEDYLGYLVDEKGQLNLNSDAFKELTKAKINDLIATEEQRHYNAVLAISNGKLTTTVKKAVGWWDSLWTIIRGGKVSVTETKKTLEELEDKINDMEGEAGKAAQEALKAENKTYQERMALLRAALKGVGKDYKKALGIVDAASKSASKKSSTKEWWETELDNLKNQFKYNEITIEEYIRGLDNLLSKVGKGTDAWRQINEELQKQRLSKVDDDYKRGTISLEEYIAKLKELIKAYRQGTEAWNELADKIKDALKDLANKQKDALETAKDAATSIIEDEIDRLKTLQKAEEDRYDKLIEEKKKANEETEKELELAKLQEALENAKKEKTKRVWHEGIGWVWEADQEAVKKAQEDLDKFNREDEVDELEKQKEAASKTYEDKIDALEKYKDAWDDVASEYEKQQARIVLAQQLGADAEKNLLGDRITYLEEYEKKYKQIMAEIAKYEKTPSTKLAGADTPTGGTTDGTGGTAGGAGGADTSSGASGASSLEKGSHVSVKPGTKWYSNSYGGGKSGNARSGTIKYINSGGSHPYNIDGLGWVKKTDIVGYRHGGTVDYTGLAMLHGTKSKPEFVLNNDQMKSMLANFTRPQTTSNISGGNSAVTNYNFGNIELPNVSNAQQFVTELKSLINIQKHQ
jgi:TP901 family phage tail tape measure protein